MKRLPPLLTVLLALSPGAFGAAPNAPLVHNSPSLIATDHALELSYGPEQMILPDGLQPTLLHTRSGTLVVQGQLSSKPLPTSRMHYPSELATVISRDGGATWTPYPHPADDNGVDIEGGALQLRDGTLIALDTYVVPAAQPHHGVGRLYLSHDDWKTLEGPLDAPFDLPHCDFYASSDDNGRPHQAERLHRRIIELPDGKLLTTLYGQWEGDHTPSTYEPKMMKTRVVLVGSDDHGRSWHQIATVASEPVGTEGMGEPVIARVSQGGHAGRLICLIRTGRNLYHCTSDDGGLTWTKAAPLVFADLDVTHTRLWVDQFRHVKGHSGKFLDENNPDELQGAAVDPDLIELRSGLLVAAFGIRVPQKSYKVDWTFPWNGNYLAISRDHGETWSTVVRLTSGIPTTHYMGIEETNTDNELYVTYDHGFWGRNDRYIYGRTVRISGQPAGRASAR